MIQTDTFSHNFLTNSLSPTWKHLNKFSHVLTQYFVDLIPSNHARTHLISITQCHTQQAPNT